VIDPLQLGLSEQDFQIVCEILDAHVPDRPVYIFGSRATGKARRRSDIDLAIGGNEPLTLQQRGLINLDFEESDLPVTVDVLDLNAIESDFRGRIARDFIQIRQSEIATQ
jgi:predicted nucleotidyltransferase